MKKKQIRKKDVRPQNIENRVYDINDKGQYQMRTKNMRNMDNRLYGKGKAEKVEEAEIVREGRKQKKGWA